MNGMAHDNGRLRSIHLFAGAGGGILADLLLGHLPVCAVEIEDYPRRVLLQRQRDGMLPEFPVWDDVQTFDGKPWRGLASIVAGGFPCQDISAAGRGAGLAGERSGLWSEMARIVSEVRPRFVFVENSPLLISRGLDVVLGDLAALGFDAAWGIVGAHHAGAPHKRDRCWILADAGGQRAGSQRGEAGADRGRRARRDESPLRQAHGQDGTDWVEPASKGKAVADAAILGRTQAAERQEPKKPKPVVGGPTSRGPRKMADACRGRCGESQGGKVQQSRRAEVVGTGEGKSEGCWWETEPAVGGVAHGVAAVLDAHGVDACEGVGRVATGIRHRADRLKAIGNGQCPQAAAIAWRILEGLHHE